MWKSTANSLLEKVHRDYDLISRHFSQTREFMWKDLDLIKKYLQPSQTVLDVGCGNGRLIDLLYRSSPLTNFHNQYTGLDISSNLLSEARNRYPQFQFIQGDVLNLPFEDNQFDSVFAIALLHHIPSYEFRLKAVFELARVLKPHGMTIASVWNLQSSEYQRLRYFSFIRSVCTMTKYDVGDMFIPWKNDVGRLMAKRYYYAFSLENLIDLFSQRNFDVIDAFGSRNGKRCESKEAANLFVVARKN